MSARRKPELRLVGKAVEPSTEQLLRRHFAERDELAARMRVLDTAIAACGRIIADERGVAFMRVEQLRQEFGAR